MAGIQQQALAQQQQQQQQYKKREKKPLLIVDPNTKQPIIKQDSLIISQPQQSTTPTPSLVPVIPPVSTAVKPTLATVANVATVAANATTTALQIKEKDKDKGAQDIQAQVLRNLREQNSNKAETVASTNEVSTPTPTPSANLPKPTTNVVIKQATVSVQQHLTTTSENPSSTTPTPASEPQQAPQPPQPPQAQQAPQPLSYSSIISKPKSAAVVPSAVAATAPVKAKTPSPSPPTVKPVSSDNNNDNNNNNSTNSQAKPVAADQPEVIATKTELIPSPDQEQVEVVNAVLEAEEITKVEEEEHHNEETVSSETPESFVSTHWTPENLSGKKRYDREFLLSLKDKKLSLAFPDALKGLDIVQDMNKPQQQQQSHSYHSKSSYGGQSNQGDQQYGKGSMTKKSMGSKYGSMNKYTKGSMEGGRGQQQQQQQQSTTVINLDKDLQLKRTENPYQIKKVSNETEELLREVRNILNKLTPQNLEKLTHDLIKLNINTEDRLKESIDIIFEKSIDEQVFSQTYAELCCILAQIKVPVADTPGKLVNFRTMLLTRCQKEFDSDYQQSISYDKLINESEACADEQKRRELKEIADDKLLRAKRRSLGNIRFIGELFKLKMLTEGIMNDCIERLLKQETDEENLECLCKLLSTIGKELDKPINTQKMKSYFDKLDKIAKKKDAVSSRIRFMILDVIDLRKNGWVPRRKDYKPQKIDEIRKEAEEEQQRQEAARQLDKQRSMNQSSPGPKGGKYMQQNISKSTSMDSEAFHSRSNKTQNGSMVNKIKDVRTITTKNLNGELLLGPGGGTGFSWNKPKPPLAEAPAAQAPVNLPQSASFTSYNDERRSLQPQQKTRIAHEHHAQPISRLSMDSTKSLSYKQEPVRRVEPSSREASVSRADLAATPSTSNTSIASSSSSSSKGKTYTSDEIERKACNLVDEYSQHKNITESFKDFDEFTPNDPEQSYEFVEKIILAVLERNESIRTSLGQLFFSALKENKIEAKAFEEGLKRVVEIADDMAIDVPKISTYLSQIIAPLFNENSSVQFLANACEPIMDKPICGELIAEVLHSASNRLGHSTVSEIFRASQLNIKDFLKGVSSPAEFIKASKIQWISGNRERTQSASVSLESYEKVLDKILDVRTENETIFDQIEAEFGEVDCHSKAFVRALVISVCNSCLVEKKIDAELFKKRGSILNKYIAKKEDLELEALFAIQILDHRMKHQPGIVCLSSCFWDDFGLIFKN